MTSRWIENGPACQEGRASLCRVQQGRASEISLAILITEAATTLLLELVSALKGNTTSKRSREIQGQGRP